MLQLEVDLVTLEWVHGGFEVVMYQGSVGVGGVVPNPLAGEIIEEVVCRARLERRAEGVLTARIGDRQRKFMATELDHFGETAFEIRLVT